MLFGVHMHQPVDNFDFVIKKAVEVCYKPFFETIKNSNFKFAFHCSGWLFEKIRDDYSDLFELILKLHSNNQIELFSAGFYEPILSTIPKEDRIFQINLHQDFLKKYFGKKAKGAWITERVWDYEILKDLVECGIEYIVLDDNHFLEKNLNGYYLTEDGKVLKVFAISQNLRYLIPFKSIEEIKKSDDLVHFDDIEKFGLWPFSYKRCYEDGFLREFIKEIKTQFFSEYIENNLALGLTYLKTTSYKEMEEWSRGVFKSFFVKYKESNHLHKRMLMQKNSISKLKLQANDVYWHGVFGGIYLPNLRDNAYRYLAECEEEKKGVLKKDFNLDGKEEIIFYEDEFIYIFNSNLELIECLDRKNRFNFLNTLKRRFEEYHTSKEEKIKEDTIHNLSFSIEKFKEYLVYDKYEKYSFIDFLFEDIDYLNYKRQNFKNNLDLDGKILVNRKIIMLSDKQINKKIEVNNKNIRLDIENKTNFIYATELNFHFAKNFLINNEEFKEEVLINPNLEIFDKFTNRKVKITSTANKIYPQKIYSVNRSESGFELILQGVSFLFIFEDKIDLKVEFE